MYNGRKSKAKDGFVPDTALCRQGCIYFRSLGGSKLSGMACHYFLDTGKLRRCEMTNCIKYDTEKKHRVKSVIDKRREWTSGIRAWNSFPYIRTVYK